MKDEIAKYKEQIKNLQKQNKFLKDKQEKFILLNDMFSEMLKLEDLESIYKYIATSLQKYFANTIVLYVSINEQNNETYLEAVEGIESKLLNKIQNISGFNPIGKKYKLLPEHNDYFRAGNLVEFCGGLAEFSSTEYSEFIARTIETLIGLHKIYTIGILKDENLLAAVHFFTFSKAEINDNFFIETFVKYAGIVLQKKIAEQALKESEILLNETGKTAKVGGWKIDLKTQKHTWTKEVFKILEASFDHQPTIEEGINFYDDNSKKIIQKALDEAIKYGKPFNLDLGIITAKGNKKQVKALGKIQHDINGKPEIVFGTFQDITDRKKAEQVLKESEEKYRLITENAADVIWILNLTKKAFTYISPSVFALRGYTPEEAMEQDINQSLTPGSAKEVTESVEQALPQFLENPEEISKKTYRHELRQTCKDGSQIWIETTTRYQFNANNEIEVIGISRNIEDRKKAELALKESEEKANALLKAIPDLMFRMNKEGVYLDYKASRSELYSQDVNSIIGLKIRNITPKQFADLVDKNIIKTLETNEIQIFEYDLEIPNKGLRQYEARMVPSGKDEVITIVRDITDRKKAEKALKESEEKLNLMLKNSNDIFVLVNEKGEQIFISDVAKDLTGYTIEELEGPISNVIYPDDLNIVLEHWNNVVSNKNEVFTVKYRHKHKEKGYVWFEAVTQNLLDNPSINAIIANIRDITEQKKAEQTVKESEEKLKILNADKDRFMQILAHDLKSPFNSLIGFSNLLLKNLHKYDIGKIEKQLLLINQTTNQTYNLLEDLLLWSKSQSGKLPFEPQKIGFGEICIEVINTLKHQADTKEITINYFEPEKVYVNADINMLKIILRNLISNAIKFTNKDGQISIYVEKNRENITVIVSDNGVGIKKENIPKLWDFTTPISTSGTADEQGTGFGLLLCKEFIEKHGGKIWVESELGNLPAGKAGGSDFKFTIPIKDLQEND